MKKGRVSDSLPFFTHRSLDLHPPRGGEGYYQLDFREYFIPFRPQVLQPRYGRYSDLRRLATQCAVCRGTDTNGFGHLILIQSQAKAHSLNVDLQGYVFLGGGGF